MVNHGIMFIIYALHGQKFAMPERIQLCHQPGRTHYALCGACIKGEIMNLRGFCAAVVVRCCVSCPESSPFIKVNKQTERIIFSDNTGGIGCARCAVRGHQPKHADRERIAFALSAAFSGFYLPNINKMKLNSLNGRK